MTRPRKIKKWSGTSIIRLTSSDMQDLGLKIGDEIDVEGLAKLKVKKKGDKK